MFTDNKTVAERLAICEKCERYSLGICGECGCVMQLKSRLSGMSCPLQKWGRAEDKNA